MSVKCIARLRDGKEATPDRQTSIRNERNNLEAHLSTSDLQLVQILLHAGREKQT